MSTDEKYNKCYIYDRELQVTVPLKKKRSSNSSLRRDSRIVDTLVFKLIVAMNGTVKPFAERYGRRFKITVTEWRVLATIASEPDRSGEDIARTLCMERMTVSRAVRRLENGGNVARRSDPTNKKRNLWRLTAAGWKIFDEIVPDAQQRQRRLLAEFSKTEKERLAQLLDKVIQQLDDA